MINNSHVLAKHYELFPSGRQSCIPLCVCVCERERECVCVCVNYVNY